VASRSYKAGWCDAVAEEAEERERASRLTPSAARLMRQEGERLLQRLHAHRRSRLRGRRTRKRGDAVAGGGAHLPAHQPRRRGREREATLALFRLFSNGVTPQPALYEREATERLQQAGARRPPARHLCGERGQTIIEPGTRVTPNSTRCSSPTAIFSCTTATWFSNEACSSSAASSSCSPW